MTTMAQDHERADLQLCAPCGQPRPALAVEAGDPYCSSKCAKKAHGVRDLFDDPKIRDGAALRKTVQEQSYSQRALRRTFDAWAERHTGRGLANAG